MGLCDKPCSLTQLGRKGLTIELSCHKMSLQYGVIGSVLLAASSVLSSFRLAW
jgi:hypothetical protein